MPDGAPDMASLGIGLVGLAISLAGVLLLRPSGARLSAVSDRRSDADAEGRPAE